MTLQGLGECRIVCLSMAAWRFKEQIKTHCGRSCLDQAIQHRCMDLSWPGPLAQGPQQRIAAEICIRCLLQAEVVDGHDHQLIRHWSDPAGFLHRSGETQLQAAQPGAAQAGAHSDHNTEGQDGTVATQPGRKRWSAHD